MAFIIDTDSYYHNRVLFVLKNDGATYQQLVNKIFMTLTGKTMEVYLDDMITKSVKEINHVKDLEETFKILRHHGIKLSPRKCTFGVRSAKFLGYMINQRGIEANPDKVKVVLNMKSPIRAKEVQKLTDCIATLGRFMSTYKCLLFFKVLK